MAGDGWGARGAGGEGRAGGGGRCDFAVGGWHFEDEVGRNAVAEKLVEFATDFEEAGRALLVEDVLP